MPRTHEGLEIHGRQCHATAHRDAAAAQERMIAQVAQQGKLAKAAQFVLNALVSCAAMTRVVHSK